MPNEIIPLRPIPLDGSGLPVIGQGEDPMAAVLREAMKQHHPTERHTIVTTNDEGQVIEKRPEPEEIILVPFDDGVLLKGTPNAKYPGTWLICDSKGTCVATALDSNICDIITKGVHMFYTSAQEHLKAAEQQAAAVDITKGEPVVEKDEPKLRPLPPSDVEMPYIPLD